MKPTLLTTTEVAAKLGISRQQVLKYIADGRIPAVTIGKRRFVEARHAKKPKALKRGRPKG